MRRGKLVFRSLYIVLLMDSDKMKNLVKTEPTGAFPPIYICDMKKLKKEEEDNKFRGFSKDEEKTIVSIKDILEERRSDDKPFISLG